MWEKEKDREKLACEEQVIKLEDEFGKIIKFNHTSLKDLKNSLHGKYNINSIMGSKRQYEEDRITYKKLEINSIHENLIDKDGNFYPFSWYKIKVELCLHDEFVARHKKLITNKA